MHKLPGMKAEVAVSIETLMLDMRPIQNQIALQKESLITAKQLGSRRCAEMLNFETWELFKLIERRSRGKAMTCSD